MSFDFNKIKKKLARLKNIDKNYSVFGSSTHKYKNHPVPISEIEKFEEKHNFQFPENFRLFLTEIGYGAGPYYGIRSLSEISKYVENLFLFDYVVNPVQWTLFKVGIQSKNPFGKDQKANPNKPFSLTRKNIDRINNNLNNRDWEYIGDFSEKSVFPADGTILICHPGCHYEVVLITCGELVGSVWTVERDEENSNWLPEEFKPERKQVSNTRFETWYEDWLDFSLTKFTNK